MESQLYRPQQDYAQGHEVDPQGARLNTGIEGEQKQHDEKPAVLKKVKEKVKKLKNKMGIKKNDDGCERGSDSSSEEEGMEVDDDGYKEDDEPNITSAPTSQPRGVSVGAEKVEPEKVKLGDAIGDIKEDPAAPRSANPPARGGADIGITPLIKEFESMTTGNKPTTEIEPNKPKTELETDEPKTELEPDEPKTEKLDEPKTLLEPNEFKTEREPNESMAQLEPNPETQLSDTGSTGQPNASYTEKLKSMATVPTEYGKNIATTVYDKLSNAGTTVVQKIRGPTQNNNTETTSEVNQDKGVSYKEYISEKLKPGEEDAALSEVISEVVQKRKEDVGNATKGGMATAQTKTTAGGVGMVEKIRGAVTSVVGGGGRSDDTTTAANDVPQEKDVVQKRKEDVGNGTEGGMATDQTKTTAGGVGMVEKIRGAVTSVVGGGGRSDDTTTAANDVPQEKVSQEDADSRMLE